MAVIGFDPIDRLIEPVARNWPIELYGDYATTSYVLHIALTHRSRYERVYLLVAQEFGGIKTDLISRFCRLYGCCLSNIMVARTFSNREVIEKLSELGSWDGESILVAYPYSYLTKNPKTYWEATTISGLLMKLSQKNSVIIFNTITKFGEASPEGGSMHHHVVKVMVKLMRSGRRVYAKLVKHPSKPTGVSVSFHTKLLEELVLMGRERTLLDWLRNT